MEEKIISKYLENNKKIKQLEEENEEIKVTIKLQMAEQETNDLSNEEFIVMKKTFKRTALDKEKIEKFCEETGSKLEDFQKISEYDQMIIKKRGNQNGE